MVHRRGTYRKMGFFEGKQGGHRYTSGKILILLALCILLLRALFLAGLPGFFFFFHGLEEQQHRSGGVRSDKFLEVPQMVWGLNNQKIAFARACLTARYLNRTLLMPSMSASLVHKDLRLLQPVSFDKIFDSARFNSLCAGFARLAPPDDLHNKSFELRKGSGRRWTKNRDLDQLNRCRESPIDEFELIRVSGKHPFLWHDHWPVSSYARIFNCMRLVDEIEADVAAVVRRIEATGGGSKAYMAVHMRLEKDWMLHCRNLERRSNATQICSGKKEITERVAGIEGLTLPVVVYVAVADGLLEGEGDGESMLRGWGEGMIPMGKRELGVWDLYGKHSYLVQSAIDHEVCYRASVFVGNSYSTFSSLVVLRRTQALLRAGVRSICGANSNLSSYAYNIAAESGRGPKKWITRMSAPTLRDISYGTNNISCSISR